VGLGGWWEGGRLMEDSVGRGDRKQLPFHFRAHQ
jgi:hypothetical protein